MRLECLDMAEYGTSKQNQGNESSISCVTASLRPFDGGSCEENPDVSIHSKGTEPICWGTLGSPRKVSWLSLKPAAWCKQNWEASCHVLNSLLGGTNSTPPRRNYETAEKLLLPPAWTRPDPSQRKFRPHPGPTVHKNRCCKVWGGFSDLQASASPSSFTGDTWEAHTARFSNLPGASVLHPKIHDIGYDISQVGGIVFVYFATLVYIFVAIPTPISSQYLPIRKDRQKLLQGSTGQRTHVSSKNLRVKFYPCTNNRTFDC